MNIKLARIVVCSLISVTLVGPAAADGGPRIGLAFDRDGLVRQQTVPGFATFEFYVVGHDLGDISYWEAGLEKHPEYSILYTTPFAALENFLSTPTNYIVSLGGCDEFGSGPNWLLRITGGYFAGPIAPELVFCLTPSSPSLLPDDPLPAYVDCWQDVHAFQPLHPDPWAYPTNCVVANPATVAVDAGSWGELKSATH